MRPASVTSYVSAFEHGHHSLVMAGVDDASVVGAGLGVRACEVHESEGAAEAKAILSSFKTREMRVGVPSMFKSD
jgi:hypothetical protein